jgi:hypothetical protein
LKIKAHMTVRVLSLTVGVAAGRICIIDRTAKSEVRSSTVVAKKTGNENFPNVNLVLSICQLIVT